MRIVNIKPDRGIRILLGAIPILILLTLSVCSIWRDALRTKKQNENPNE